MPELELEGVVESEESVELRVEAEALEDGDVELDEDDGVPGLCAARLRGIAAATETRRRLRN